ncbi:MAG: LPXTG cell wall anchor domain-containing protein, partial [Jatrophihabitantaceae bacterium]
SYVSATGAGWTCSASPAGVVSCALAGTIAVGADSSDLTITATVGAAAYPSVTNTATVSSTDPDLPGSATASDPVIVDPSASLQLTKKHQGSFQVGSTGSYLLTVSNTGPTATPGPVTIADTLPTGLSYRSAAGTGWTCTAAGSTISCSRPGPLAAGASSQLRIVVNVLAAAYPSVLNSATASATGSPSATGTDTAPVSSLVVLTISKHLMSYRNNLASYLMTVTNTGPNGTASAITVTDPLPAGLSYRSASGAGWSCGAAGQTVTCERSATLAAGASASLTLVAAVTAAPGTTIGNVATVRGGGSAGATNRTTPSNQASLSVTATGGGAGSGGLPDTGRDTADPAMLATGLLLVGLGLLLLGRRRRWS